ncbi:MAG: TIM barrel protein, partial [Verrucomicrobiae bacterium]|nr:TIM barrel protein [Verrucomicrobiae bacterium]
MSRVPDISLITSWHVGWPHPKQEPLSGLTYALESGIRLFDLYFLNHDDVPWYLEKIEQSGKAVERDHNQRSCPLRFAASLSIDEIKVIADELLKKLIEEYRGRLIGTRPRIVALATYWPLISDNNPEIRELAVRAARSSLVLAGMLGCRHVEIVGGFSFSPEDGAGQVNPDTNRERIATEVRDRRMRQLRQSLIDVFESAEVPGGVFLCMEAEPGSAYLIQDVPTFHEMHRELPSSVKDRVVANIDLAHMFLADSNRKEGAKKQIDYIRENALEDCIGHFHASDHARSHASDLCPGSYHFFEDYKPWLDLAIELTGRPKFSNAMAIEMEACSDIHEVKRAIGRTRSWLAERVVEGPISGVGEVEGVIMAVDIVNSTDVLALQGLPECLDQASRRIETAVSALCRQIQHHRGSVYSFTGDGVVALFDQQYFHSQEECMTEAIASASALFAAMRSELEKIGEWEEMEESKLRLRVSMLWGKAKMPEVGSLKYQLLGGSVIAACRMLNAFETGKGGTLAALAIHEGVSKALRAGRPSDSVEYHEIPVRPEPDEIGLRFRRGLVLVSAGIVL